MVSEYAEIAARSDDELRELLVSGEPVERIWAMWALGLRRAAAASPALVVAVHGEPTPGVRRHFAVLFAAFGEHPALMELALLDPDEYVRATALQYATVLAASAAERVPWPAILARLEEDPAPPARLAIVEHVPDDAPPPVRAAVLRHLEDPDADVRAAVLDYLARQWQRRHDGGGALPPEVRARAQIEPSRELRRALLGLWLRADGVAPVLRALVATGDEALALEALAIAPEQVPALGWDDVEPLRRSSTPAVQHALFALFEGRLDEVPLAWLLAHALEHHQLVGDVLDQLATRLPGATPAEVPRELFVRLAQHEDQLLDEAAATTLALEAGEGEEDHTRLEAHLAAVTALLIELQRRGR